ncbi:DNA polymerase III subunit gamma and tau [Marisediminicola sp. LYQ134]|uniref:DNA polymerase III subunit gamma and tau n=1 Tax=Marisediminicola sp. LYQ134 TaxID=3391061 RepID=UPI003982E3A7
MVTALYRRYRPETFAELIGQSQVTDPLRTALRSDRVNHAYLFSGPRGCGKTTSARILARCLNCVEGPTDTPCGVCPSCVELSRDGAGSLDVVEIDAASHNGVDDARDLRERAVFAPARDRYKIFILDEAHMVTPQGFNALLKIVEEPPEHIKFIFATTEPDKVIGTIRSRTHHYPFRLVPPAQMLEYLQQLCESEKVEVEAGVLPLVVRAGGGSVRDTLSLLDQLIAGSDTTTVQYERAVALLGYTHGALLSEVVDALGSRDAAAAFAAVDRVIQTGQDPRRFVEDLLERLRDLVIVGAVSFGGSLDAAASVLRGVEPEELDRMSQQAAMFGTAGLSRAADVVNAALTEMTGATSPRLHLELMIARVLVPASDETERGALARVERLERRIGIESPEGAAPPASVRAAVPAPASEQRASEQLASRQPAPQQPPAEPPVEVEVEVEAAAAPAVPPAGEPDRPVEPVQPTSVADVHEDAPDAPAPVAPAAPVTLQHVKDAWPEILEAVQKAKRAAWMVVYTAHVLDLRDDVLYLSFVSENDVTSFKQQTAGHGVSEYLRNAIVEVLGLRVKFVARVDASAKRDSAPALSQPDVAPVNDDAAGVASAPPVQTPAAQTPAAPTRRAQTPPLHTATAAPATTWATVAVPGSDPGSASDSDTREAAPAANRAPEPLRSAGAASAATREPIVVPEPVDEADREPEPEFEPDDSPIVGATPPAGAGAGAAAPAAPPAREEPAPRAAPRAPARPELDKRRYGESVVREILGASFIEELSVAPRVTPRGD